MPAGRAADDDSTRTELPRDNPFAAGRIVAGKYEVLECLGTGGFGTVYKVRHARRRKLYALKIPRREFLDSETFQVRFEREIEAMERFVHPDAVMIRDSGFTEAGVPYYTMDFIEGESLREVLCREGTLSVERAIDIAQHVLRVLEVAHEHRIIHRDVKPENVLLTLSDGREAVKVVDFGVAKLLDLAGTAASITGGERVGTPAYMSPEQITGDPLDPRSDLFSIGILLYEMLTGRHPFATEHDAGIVTAAILEREPSPPGEERPGIPRSLNDLVLSLLAKRPRSRPLSAAHGLRSLDAIRNELPPSIPRRMSVALLHEPSRAPCTPLVLREATREGERRRFIFFGERVTFGRSGASRDHVILRRLPCRSAGLDPENWAKNLTISQLAGSLAVDGRVVVIDADRDAPLGIGIGGLERQRSARLGSDRFQLSLGDRALELDGTRFLRGCDLPELDLSALAPRRVRSAVPSADVGYSASACRVDCVRILRADNWPLHEYYLVQRLALIGAGATMPIRLRARGVLAVHAAVVVERGEAFLVALDGRMTIRGLISAGAGGPISGLELEPGHMVPLVPGLTVAIGDALWTVTAVDDADFKRI